MLKLFRKKMVTRVIFWALVILICLGFVMWDVGGFSPKKTNLPKFVGVINKNKVPFNELYNNITATRVRIILNYFNQQKIVDALLNNRPLLAKLAWDRIIMLGEVKTDRIKVPDKEVVNYIRTHPLFLRNGVFDTKIYNYILQYNMGLTPRSFEEIIRQDLAIQKVKDVITKDVKVTDEEVLNEYRAENEKFKISYAAFYKKDFLDKMEIGDDAAMDYYEKHKNEFLLPAKADEDVPKYAEFDNVKESIIAYLKDIEARTLASKSADEIYEKIKELMDKDKKTFGAAVSACGLELKNTDLFSRSEALEGIGEAGRIAAAAKKLKTGEAAGPVETKDAFLIFEVSGYEDIDQEKFKEEKADFEKKVLIWKKDAALDVWFRNIALRASLKVDLADIDKYYR